MNRILMSGGDGFLLSSCVDELGGEIIPYVYGEEYRDVDLVIHFASPNDKYEFEDKYNMAFTMLDYSISIIKQAISNNAKVVFASSKAAGYLEDEYGVYKKSIEQYIQGLTDNYLIYRIPAVYGTSRKKGLMKQLRLGDIGDGDWDKEIPYIDIEDFKKWFLINIDKVGIIRYNKKYHKNTIKEIRNIYI